MKKYFLTVLASFLLPLNSYAKESLKVDVGNFPKKAIERAIKINRNTIKSEIDVTHLVAFVPTWKKLELRENELLNLYSDVVPKAFKKYPASKEFHFATYVKYKNKKTNKLENKYVSKIIITKDQSQKIDWNSIKENKSENFKQFKLIDFSKI